jgi:hypothetical protein
MTELFVDPAGLTELYNLLYRVEMDATAALNHVKAHCDLQFYREGIIFHYIGPHEHAYGDITTKLDGTAQLASGLRTRVNLMQNLYTHVDHEAAQRVDAAYRGSHLAVAMDVVVAQQRPDLAANHGAFRDLSEPEMRLRTPQWAADSTTYELDVLTGLLSPSAWIRAACQEVFHLDPFQPWVKAVSGDWSGYYACSVVWAQVGQVAGDLSGNLLRAVQDLPIVWRGNTADALQAFLVEFASALTELSGECYFYSERYRERANAAQEFFTAVSKPVSDFLDVIIYAAVASAIGTAAIETVIGGVIGYAAAAYWIARAIEIYYIVEGAYDSFEAWVSLSAGTLDLYHSNLNWSLPQLSTVAVPQIG